MTSQFSTMEERAAAKYAALGTLGRDSSHSNDADDAALYDLDQYALNGQSKELELLLLAAVFILGRLAILGQATVIYGKPNSGKTLLMLMLLRAGILSGEINAADIYFLNADDHFRGAVQKLKLAEQHGFKMLVPSHNGFKAEMLAAILRAHCLMGTARGKVLILDTLKKFMDLMNKSKGSEFMKSVREFVSHGGSVIMLAHTNKHRNDDGDLIYAGTADVVDDCDAAYTLDTVADDLATRTRTVKFTNFKARGDNQLEASYQYSIAEGASYLEKLDSVRHLADENLREIQLKQQDAETLAKNAPVIDAINEAIECGFVKKTMLIKQVMAEAGFSKKTITQVLKQHTGASGTTALWRITKGADNAMLYSLNVDF